MEQNCWLQKPVCCIDWPFSLMRLLACCKWPIYSPGCGQRCRAKLFGRPFPLRKGTSLADIDDHGTAIPIGDPLIWAQSMQPWSGAAEASGRALKCLGWQKRVPTAADLAEEASLKVEWDRVAAQSEGPSW